MYKKYAPHYLLNQYIERYWFSNGFLEEEKIQRIFPDGCVDIIFSLVDEKAKNGMQSFLPYIVGTMTSFLDVPLLGKVKMLGIRFKPGGITAFTKVPVYNFTDQSLELQFFETILEKSFYENLYEKNRIGDILNYIDRYLLQKLPELFFFDKRINHMVSIINQTKGNASISFLLINHV